MSRAPRIAPYRVSHRLAQGPDGAVFKVWDANSDQPYLLVVSTEGQRSSSDRVAARLAGLDPDLVVRSGAGEQVWAALLPDEERRAVALVGLDGVPEQNWLAEAYGWPSLYPRSPSQLAVRSAVAIIVLLVAFSLAQLLRG